MKSTYLFWYMLIQPADNDMILYFPIRSKKDEPGGVAFMVNSPWSNSLVSGETGGKGIPDFKLITARISLSKDEITTIENLIGLNYYEITRKSC